MAIMYKYKQGDSKGPSTLVVKPAAPLPADLYEGGINKDYPKEKKNMVDGKVFSLADERDY